MEFSIDPRLLIGPLKILNTIVIKNHTIHALRNIRFSANNDSITLSGSDLSSNLSVSIKTPSKRTGDITINAQKLIGILNLTHGGDVHFSSSDDFMTVSHKRSSFKLRTLPTGNAKLSDFIDPPRITFTVDSSTLRSSIESIKYAIASKHVCPQFTGMKIEVGSGKIQFVATDAFRLALSSFKVDTPIVEELSMVLSGRAVNQLCSLLASRTGPAEVSLSRSHFFVTLGDYHFSSKKLEGIFPSYEKLLAKKHTHQATLDRNAFCSTLSRIATMSDDMHNSVALTFTANQLSACANGPDHCAEETLPAKYNGKSLDIIFRSSFLIDTATSMQSEQIALSLSGPFDSILTQETVGPVSVMHLLMPIKN